MARPGGKAGGRVSIRVVPDATKFRNDLHLLLKRVEQSMSANLMVTADTAAAEVSLRRFQRDWNGRKVSLAAAVDSVAASAHMRLISRPRIVPLVVRVSQASVARAATIIASLAGARVAGDLVKNLTERLENLDRALPKIALVSQSIAGLTALLLSSVGGIITVGAGLSQILGLAVTLPGILTGAAVGGTVFAVALSDIKNRLGDLAPAMADLKSIITDNFWATAEEPIRSFVSSVLPGLRSGLGQTSSALGNWSASVAAAFQNALGGGVLDRLFGHLVESINIASTGTGSFVDGLVRLGDVGGSYLPRLAQWFADLSDRFATFIETAAGDGTLQRFIENGITAAGQLGSALGSIGSTLNGIFTAAQAAGGGGLASFADTMARIATVVNGPLFQFGLTRILEGAAAGASGLAAAFRPIGNMLFALAPAISKVLSSSGQVVGDFLGQIASALSSPAFANGLTEFFAGLQEGILAIGPSLPAIADAFGELMSFAGALGAQLGPVLGTTLAALAPILTALLTALEPLLPALGTELVEAIGLLGATMLPLVLQILPPLVSILITLLPILVPLIDLLNLLLLPLQMLGPVLSVVADIVKVTAGLFIGALAGAIRIITQLVAGDLMGAGKTAGDVFSTLASIVTGAFLKIQPIVAGVVNGIINLINNVIRGINEITSAAGGAFGFKVGAIPSLGYVPSLAEGATILPTPGGTLTRLGEGGRAETVVDYGKMNRNLELSSRLMARMELLGRGGEMPPINVYGAPGQDERLIARYVWQEFDDDFNGMG